MTSDRPVTLRELERMPLQPSPMHQSVVMVIDAQQEYLSGALPLEAIDAALANIDRLLTSARTLGRPVIHIVQSGEPGGLFDPDHGGRLLDGAAPRVGEHVVSKLAPNAFTVPELRALIASMGDPHVVLCGFMTHMCISATARAALDHDLATTVVSDACASRALPSATASRVLPATQIHETALSELADLFAVVATTDEVLSA